MHPWEGRTGLVFLDRGMFHPGGKGLATARIEKRKEGEAPFIFSRGSGVSFRRR